MTTNDPAPEPTTEPAKDNDPAWYRDQIEASKKVNTGLQEKLERLAFQGVGLDPEIGMGKAIKMTFEGDIDPENLQPLIEHAKSEFDTELSTASTNATTTARPEVSEAESRIAALDSASSPAEPNALQEEADGKLSQGDTEGAIAAMLTKQIADGNLNIGGPKQN